MKTELKRCPFCGGTEIIVDNDQGLYFVYCEQCVCQTTLYRDKENAIEAWNRRTEND